MNPLLIVVLIVLGVLGALALLAAVFGVGIHNKIVSLRNRFKNAYAQIDVQLKRRYDLIPNLVETAKGYIQHERGTFEAVIAARNAAMSANTSAAAISRQREFLADASSVQFTRNPTGLSGALHKIGGAGSRVESAHAGEASHMFFGNGLGKPLLGMLATHPPLEGRIRAIVPDWDGQYKPTGVTAEMAPLASKFTTTQ